AKRSTSPLVITIKEWPRPEGPEYLFRPFQGWRAFLCCYQGRRASRLPLAFILRAFGAAIDLFLLHYQPEIAWIEPVELRVWTLDGFQVRFISGHLLFWSNHKEVSTRDVFAFHAVAREDALVNLIFPFV